LRFSLIVPCFNHVDVSRQFLRSLLAYGPLGDQVELILVDDASTDDTAQWMESLQSSFVSVVRHAENQGFACAMNSGVDAAKGEFVVLLNNDLLLTQGWFDPFIACADAWSSQLGIVGNVQIRAVDHGVDHAGVEFTEQGQLRHVQQLNQSVAQKNSPLLTGACLMLPKRDFIEYGGFDTAYLNGGEDMELCLQAVSRGRRNLVLMRSVILHHVSASRASPLREVRDLSNLVRLYTRWLEVLAQLYAFQYPTGNAKAVIEAELARLQAHLAMKQLPANGA
jgi:GT2 family glycosyltransferase